MASSLNWYSVRHHTKLSLVTVTIIFFLYTVCNLFLVKQFYIKRYIELHLQNVRPGTTFGSEHKSFQVDEELDLPSKMNLSELHRSKNHTSSAQALSPQAFQSGPFFTLDDDTQVLGDSEFDDGRDDDPGRSHIRYVFFFAIGVIVVIEVLYCILYLYVIAQKRFCPMLCFSILSLATFLLHIQRHYTIEQHPAKGDNSGAGEQHKSSVFFEHVESLDSEALLNHITHSGWLEIGLSASETVLSIFYTILLFYFPGRSRTRGVRGFLRLGSGSSRRPQARPAVNGLEEAAAQLPNGHATAIELDFIDDDNLHHANRSNTASDDSSSQSSNSNPLSPSDSHQQGTESNQRPQLNHVQEQS